MADRIPLIVNPDASQIQELPSQDKLLLSGHLEFDSHLDLQSMEFYLPFYQYTFFLFIILNKVYEVNRT